MVVTVRSLGLSGISGYEVSVECFLSGGLPAFDIVGLPDAAVKEARERGMLIDASYGRSTRAVLIMDSDHVVLSALTPETVASRAAGQPEGKPTEEQ